MNSHAAIGQGLSFHDVVVPQRDTASVMKMSQVLEEDEAELI